VTAVEHIAEEIRRMRRNGARWRHVRLYMLRVSRLALLMGCARVLREEHARAGRRP
jgi:hypothetical protein